MTRYFTKWTGELQDDLMVWRATAASRLEVGRLIPIFLPTGDLGGKSGHCLSPPMSAALRALEQGPQKPVCSLEALHCKGPQLRAGIVQVNIRKKGSNTEKLCPSGDRQICCYHSVVYTYKTVPDLDYTGTARTLKFTDIQPSSYLMQAEHGFKHILLHQFLQVLW